MSNLRYGVRAARGALAVLARRAVGRRRRASWSLRTELLQRIQRASLDGAEEWGIEWIRGFHSAATRPTPAQRAVSFEAIDVDGIPAEWCTPSGDSAPARTLVYFQGGAYVLASLATHRDLVARIATAAQARVLAVDYRRGPEARFPAAQDDALTAYRWVLESGVAPERIALAGDSAGGALSVATCVSARDVGLPLPAAAVLLCPWVDPAAAGGSMESNDPYDIMGRSFLRLCVETYIRAAEESDPRFTPLNADLRGLPPLLIQAGEAEILLDQIREFAHRALEAGVKADLHVYPDMFHVFQTLGSYLPEARSAIDEIGDWLRARL